MTGMSNNIVISLFIASEYFVRVVYAVIKTDGKCHYT